MPGTRKRGFPMTFRQRDDKGRQLHERQFVVSSDNPLLVDEDRQLDLPLLPGAVVLEVTLVDHVHAGKTIASLIRRELRLQ